MLVTGATGFIGRRVVANLKERGFTNIRCLVRSLSKASVLGDVQLVHGSLLSQSDCAAAIDQVRVVYHLAAGRGVKSVADAFLNSVVTTRNLLESIRLCGSLTRFVSVSSLAVYSNCDKPHGRMLDESCPLEQQPALRGDAYTFAKVKQEEVVCDYAKRFQIPYVTLRPGFVYGPGNETISGRVGIGTFGLFLHLGGSNRLPCSYVDNCAEAIVLAGLVPHIEGEAFNIIDDDIPTSRDFLQTFKQEVHSFKSIYLPHCASYALCLLWEKYSAWSEDQLPPVFNRKVWHAYWKRTEFTNSKARRQLGWKPRICSREAMAQFFESCRRKRTQR